MKKISSVALLLVVTMLSVAFSSTATYAACSSFFSVGTSAETISACSGAPEANQIPGFSIDLSTNKITLNNYNGGAIYYFCRGTCAGTTNMEIELIGDNVINSQSSSPYLQESGVPQNAAFMNIIPNFTGSGTLKIDAATPFAFESPNSASFSLEIMGKDFIIVSTQASQATDVEDITEDSTPTVIETNDLSKNEPSFFDTTAGIALLISVPSVLVIIIIVLIVALARKSNKPQLPEQSDMHAESSQAN